MPPADRFGCDQRRDPGGALAQPKTRYRSGGAVAVRCADRGLAAVTARAVWELVALNKPGIYHIAGRERLSRWQIGQLVASRWLQLNPRLEPGSLLDYRGAPRSPDTSLNCAKAQQLLSFPLPGLKEWLDANPTENF